MRRIGIARARCYDIKLLFTYDLTDISYFLSPDASFLLKGSKADFQPLLKIQSISSDHDQVNSDSSILVIDFMAEARKIESRRKKFNLKTFGEVMICGNDFLSWSRNFVESTLFLIATKWTQSNPLEDNAGASHPMLSE